MATNLHLARLDALERKVAALAANDTANDLRMELDELKEVIHESGTTTAPQWRERVQLTHTLKDGWRVGEVTVEVTYSADDPMSEHERQKRLNAAIDSGNAVAERHNRLRTTTLTH